MTQSNLLFTILPSKLKTCDSLVQVRGKATQGGLFDLCLFAFYFRVTQTPGYFKLKLVLYKCNMQNVFSIEISLENCAKIQSGSLLPQLERHPHQSSVLKVTLLELKNIWKLLQIGMPEILIICGKRRMSPMWHRQFYDACRALHVRTR